MDDFTQISSGKRQRDADPTGFKRRTKRANQPFADREQQIMPTPDDTTYRILCPGAKIGSVIGKGGNIIKSLRRETHARIKVTDPVPGVDERVILIWSSPQELEKVSNGGLKGKNQDKEEEDESKDEDGASQDNEFLCPAQEALFKVHCRIIEEDGDLSDEEEEDLSQQITVRLLVPNNQIGCLLGKGGKIIEKMRNETGAQIRILPKDQLPGCALPSDELVQISGDPSVVKKAIYDISARIHESPPRDRPQGSSSFLASGSMLPPGRPINPSSILPPGYNMITSSHVGGSFVGLGPPVLSGIGGYGGVELGSAWPVTSPPVHLLPPLSASRLETKELPPEEEFTIKLLCPIDKIGIIIGKGGNAIRQLRESSGARIKVEDAVPESEERVISFSCNEFLDESSPVIEAALQLQAKMTSNGDKDSNITTRLLVQSKQIGCLLGKRGSIISEMRKKTNANIKVLKKEDLPKCAQETDELVQIIGDQNVAKEAFIEVLTRLRNDVFRDRIKAQGKPLGPQKTAQPGYTMQGAIPGVPSSYSGRGEFLSPGVPPIYSGRGELVSPGRMYTPNGLGSQEGGRYIPSYGRLGSLQDTATGLGNPSGYGGGFYTGYSTCGGVSVDSDASQKSISGPTFEVTIPGASVASVLGKGGNNIAQICKISGARVKVYESRSQGGDRIAEISGTPEQTHAAKSLLQAFIQSGQTPAGSGLHGAY